jgi:protein SCO1/2
MGFRLRIAAPLALAVAALLGACVGADEAPQYQGIVVEPAPNVGDLSLPNGAADGAETPLRAPAGGVLIAFIGFASCPDICPTTLADLRGSLRELEPEERDRVAVAMITMDPERDTAEVLANYVGSFVPGAAALRTDDPERLRAVADRLGADYGTIPGEEGEEEIFHTANLYAIGPDGRVLVQWPFGTPRDVVVEDIRLVLRDVADDKESA